MIFARTSSTSAHPTTPTTPTPTTTFTDLKTLWRCRWGERYGVPPERLYTDYKAMLAAEQPDIVSVVTQPEHRAEILIYAAAQPCVRALFPEKAFASSLAEAQAVVEACKEHGVIVNMGTLRRYDAGYDAAQRLVHSGELGQLKTIIAHSTSSLFNGSSHTFDAVNWLNKDAKPVSIMGELTADPTVEMADGTTKPLLDQDGAGNNVLRADPLGHGIVEYDNGVTAYMLNSGRGTEFEAICERGVVSAWNDGETWHLREPRGIHMLPQEEREKWTGSQLDASPNLELDDDAPSPTLNAVNDLVNALDHNLLPRGGEHGSVPLGNSELIFGLIESHTRGGAKVALPLVEHGNWRLAREDIWGRQPVFQRAEGHIGGKNSPLTRAEDFDELVEKTKAEATADARL